jgi:hypothetical protein
VSNSGSDATGYGIKKNGGTGSVGFGITSMMHASESVWYNLLQLARFDEIWRTETIVKYDFNYSSSAPP